MGDRPSELQQGNRTGLAVRGGFLSVSSVRVCVCVCARTRTHVRTRGFKDTSFTHPVAGFPPWDLSLLVGSVHPLPPTVEMIPELLY